MARPVFPFLMRRIIKHSAFATQSYFRKNVSYIYLFSGISIYYAESLDSIGDNLKEVMPDMFTTVPRLLEKVLNVS